jgi:hypothetical protein
MKLVSPALLIEALAARWNSDDKPEMEIVADFITDYAKDSGFDIPLKIVLAHYVGEADLFNPQAELPLTPGQYSDLYSQEYDYKAHGDPTPRDCHFPTNELGSDAIPAAPTRPAAFNRKQIDDMMQSDWVHSSEGEMHSFGPAGNGDVAALLVGELRGGRLFVHTTYKGKAAEAAARKYLFRLTRPTPREPIGGEHGDSSKPAKPFLSPTGRFPTQPEMQELPGRRMAAKYTTLPLQLKCDGCGKMFHPTLTADVLCFDCKEANSL